MAARSKDGAAAAGNPSAATANADPIDWARHFWRRHGLGESEEAFIAMSSVLRFHRLIVEATESRLRPHKLNITDYMLLMTLQLSETGTRLISQLARSLMVHPSTATLATDRLEALGVIARGPHPTDRRAIQVSITAKGRTLLAQVTGELREIDFGLVGSDVDDQVQLIEVLTRLRLAAGDSDAPLKAPRAGSR
ncbi:MarR family transcriptional regulator [Actinomadura sp. LD22]|uniref:MarR family transcriptional regulator n=1 Tax=Actinomadura physcomitrii TaxID=2650748 RepID=A0A6I4MLW2_9ACTN|nr:MarR family transcriptional regulator [Actinomadura physcomitrii]MWA03206.1 MarR family transcriptional regulator [Actinomadura physcomitrii]